MTPEQLKKAREKMKLTQAKLGEVVGKSERYITYRESGVQPIETTLKYAIFWLLLPKTIRKRWLPKFLR